MKMSEIKASFNRMGLIVKYVGKVANTRSYQLYWRSSDKQNGTRNYTQKELIEYINIVNYQ